MIDVHCHLTFKGLRERVDEVLAEARRSLDAVITTAFPFEESEEEGREPRIEGFSAALEAIGLSERYRGFVFVTAGLHPTQAVRMKRGDIEEYVEFVKEHASSFVGIGEVGLDRHWIRSEEEHKKSVEVFELMLQLAEELNLPVVIHARKAEEEAYRIVSNTNISHVLFHSYSGNMTLAKAIIESGYYISLNTRLHTTKNARKIARRMPLEQLLTETDAPFLHPSGEGVNTPANVKFVVEEIARLRGMSFEEVDTVTTWNAVRFFKLPLSIRFSSISNA